MAEALIVVPPKDPDRFVQPSGAMRREEKARSTFGRPGQRNLIIVPPKETEDVPPISEERAFKSTSTDEEPQTPEQRMQAKRVEKSKFNYRWIRDHVLVPAIVIGLTVPVAHAAGNLARDVYDSAFSDSPAVEQTTHNSHEQSATASGAEQVVQSIHELPPLPEFQTPDHDQRVLVVPLEEKGRPISFTDEQLQESIDHVTQFYEEATRGKIHYSFTVLPWSTVDHLDVQGLPDDGERAHQIAALGNEAIQSNDVDNLDQYQTVLYLTNKAETDTITSGRGESSATQQGKIAWLFNTVDYAMMRHELAHTLGLGHGETDKSSQQNSYSELNRDQDTGDGSPMGSGDKSDEGFTAVQQFEAGFIGKEQVQSVTHDGMFTVSEFNANNPDSTMTLRLNKADTNERYYVELRGGETPKMRVYAWDEQRGTNTKAIENPNGSLDWNQFYDMQNGVKVLLDPGSYNPDTHTANISVQFDG